MKKSGLLLPLALLLFPLSPAQAATDHYSFDKVHTQILFSVDHLGFSHSTGLFRAFDGGFTFDRNHPEKSAVDVTIHTAGIDMGDQAWDKELRGENFFDSDEFPDMVFKSTGIAMTGERTGIITGNLTLRDITKPVTIDVTFNKAERHPFTGHYVAGFSGHAKIDRDDFGMDYGEPFVGDDVDIRLEVEGIRDDQPGQEQYNQ